MALVAHGSTSSPGGGEDRRTTRAGEQALAEATAPLSAAMGTVGAATQTTVQQARRDGQAVASRPLETGGSACWMAGSGPATTAERKLR